MSTGKAPKFLYVVNFTANTVSGYSVNASTGALTSIGAAVATGSQPWCVAVNPAGTIAYVTNSAGHTVSCYSIDQSTGVLTLVATVSTGGTTFPHQILVHPNGLFAYVANFNSGASGIGIYSINQTTGELTLLSTFNMMPFGLNTTSIVINPAGTFLYSASGSSTVTPNASAIHGCSINTTTGALTSLGLAKTILSDPNSYSITMNPSGTFIYVANAGLGNTTSFSVDTGTGLLTLGTTVSAQTLPHSIVVDPTGAFAYVANFTTGTISQYTIVAGVLMIQGHLSAGGSNECVVVDPSGLFAYSTCAANNTIIPYSIDQTTGLLTAGTPLATGVNPIFIAITSTPATSEPKKQLRKVLANYRTESLTTEAINNELRKMEMDLHALNAVPVFTNIERIVSPPPTAPVAGATPAPVVTYRLRPPTGGFGVTIH